MSEPSLDWQVVDGPWFDNCVGSLHLDGSRVTLRIRGATPALEDRLLREL